MPFMELDTGAPAYTVPTAANRTPAISNGQSISYFPPNAPQAYMQEWQVGIQKQLGTSWVTEISYVGSKGTHLLYPRDSNQVPQADFKPGALQSYRPFPQYQTITTYFDDAISDYNALQLSVNRRFSSGLTVLANYTYSKSMDDCSLDLTTTSGCEYQDAYTPRATYAPSQFDQTHRVVISGVYDLPFGVGRAHMTKGGVTDGFLGGWTVSEAFSANTGFPFSVFASGTAVDPGISGTEFANITGTPTLSNPTIAEWFNTAAFTNPYTPSSTTTPVFGDTGRDIIRGPGFWDMDFSVAKQFHLPIGAGDRTHLQFRADFFNVFNHANFAQPNNTIGSAATGTITALAYSNPNNNPARQVQFGLVLSF
jgi:hypothetical protein